MVRRIWDEFVDLTCRIRCRTCGHTRWYWQRCPCRIARDRTPDELDKLVDELNDMADDTEEPATARVIEMWGDGDYVYNELLEAQQEADAMLVKMLEHSRRVIVSTPNDKKCLLETSEMSDQMIRELVDALVEAAGRYIGAHAAMLNNQIITEKTYDEALATAQRWTDVVAKADREDTLEYLAARRRNGHS